MSVLKQSALSVKPYREKRVPTTSLKGKERREDCPEWEEENEWLREKLCACPILLSTHAACVVGADTNTCFLQQPRWNRTRRAPRPRLSISCSWRKAVKESK